MPNAAIVCLVIAALSGCMESERYVETRLEEGELMDVGVIYHSERGYVPDSETAVRMAEAVLESAFGRDALRKQRPLRVMLVDTIWVVAGTIPKEALGGVIRVDISKSSGAIIRVSHGE